MATKIHEELVSLLNEERIPIDLANKDTLDIILNQIGQARIVLMGEASHGTEEFYLTRMALSKLLIQTKGFHAIAIEGDWPSAFSVHRYIQDPENETTKLDALNAFKRFPDWMWRNTAMANFIDWMKDHNNHTSDPLHKIGFYGLDLYSLHDSITSIICYLKKHQPTLVDQAIHRYGCFDHVAVDPQMYGYLVNQSIKKACIKEVTDAFLELQHEALYQMNQKNLSEQLDESLYYATQNARLVKNAEEYYRAMFEPRAISWNIRDQHMAQTLSNLITHIETKLNVPAKIIVWAHNSHIGDARATEMNDRGETNLGQIVREQYDTASYSLGFSTYNGTVRAASKWDGKSEIKEVIPALRGSYESVFHDASCPNFFLNLRHESHLIHLLKQPMLQRAIGVIYLPKTERLSHYYFSRLPYQFDGIIHLDHTSALTSLG
jgi:erythromycin esterase-like protein